MAYYNKLRNFHTSLNAIFPTESTIDESKTLTSHKPTDIPSQNNGELGSPASGIDPF